MRGSQAKQYLRCTSTTPTSIYVTHTRRSLPIGTVAVDAPNSWKVDIGTQSAYLPIQSTLGALVGDISAKHPRTGSSHQFILTIGSPWRSFGCTESDAYWASISWTWCKSTKMIHEDASHAPWFETHPIVLDRAIGHARPYPSLVSS